ATLRELRRDVEVAAVKIGMLGSAKVVKAVAEFLGNEKLPNVVLDPILKSSSGVALVDAVGAQLMIERLLPLASIVTPNVEEASALTGLAVTNPEQMSDSAVKLHHLERRTADVTGGHLKKS